MKVEDPFAFTMGDHDTVSPAVHEKPVEPPPLSAMPPGGWMSTTPTVPDSPHDASEPPTCTCVGERKMAFRFALTVSECEALAVVGTIAMSVIVARRIGRRRINRHTLCRGRFTLAMGLRRAARDGW